MITEKHVFSHGVLIIEFTMDAYDRADNTEFDSVTFDEMNAADNSWQSVDSSLISQFITDDQKTMTCYVKFNDTNDRLVQWTLKINPGNNFQCDCCTVDSEGFMNMRGYAVDITNYELSILRKADVSCDCNMSNTLRCEILRSFILRAAERSGGSLIEKFFRKIAMRNNQIRTTVSIRTGGCGCNG